MVHQKRIEKRQRPGRSLKRHLPVAFEAKASVSEGGESPSLLVTKTIQELPSVNTALLDSGSTKDVEVAQGCLLVPVVFAIWWYWTKRAARKLTKNLLRMSHHPCETQPHHHGNQTLEGGETIVEPNSPYTNVDESFHEDETEEENPPIIRPKHDAFQSWDEVLQQNTQDDTNRFVRWIRTSPTSFCSNRSNHSHKSGKAKRKGQHRRAGKNEVRKEEQNTRQDTSQNAMDRGLLVDSARSNGMEGVLHVDHRAVGSMGSFDDHQTPTLVPTSSSVTDTETEKSLGWQSIEDTSIAASNIPSYQHQAPSVHQPLAESVDHESKARNQLDQLV